MKIRIDRLRRLIRGALLEYENYLPADKNPHALARRLLDPRLPIRPQLIRLKASQTEDLTRVVYANSITLTPGTVSIAIEDDEIVVHALTRSAADEDKSGEMDRRATQLEGSRG